MAASSLAAGTAGFLLAGAHKISPPAWMALILLEERRPLFMADWWAHSASYLVGMVGGLVVCLQTYLKRGLTPGPTA